MYRFRRSAGARLTVTRLRGYWKPLLRMAGMAASFRKVARKEQQELCRADGFSESECRGEDERVTCR